VEEQQLSDHAAVVSVMSITLSSVVQVLFSAERPSQKQGNFQGAIKAIQHGWRGTWDNPEG
jgi:hypothetical protein